MAYTIFDFKADTLPAIGVPNSRYYIPNGQGTDIDEYVTDLNGSFRKVRNKGEIDLINGLTYDKNTGIGKLGGELTEPTRIISGEHPLYLQQVEGENPTNYVSFYNTWNGQNVEFHAADDLGESSSLYFSKGYLGYNYQHPNNLGNPIDDLQVNWGFKYRYKDDVYDGGWASMDVSGDTLDFYIDNSIGIGQFQADGKWTYMKSSGSTSIQMLLLDHVDKSIESYGANTYDSGTNTYGSYTSIKQDVTGIHLTAKINAQLPNPTGLKGLHIDLSGNLKLDAYPNTRNDGTLTKALGTDALGNVILAPVTSFTTSDARNSINLTNGLTYNTTTGVGVLGGSLTGDTTITSDRIFQISHPTNSSYLNINFTDVDAPAISAYAVSENNSQWTGIEQWLEGGTSGSAKVYFAAASSFGNTELIIENTPISDGMDFKSVSGTYVFRNVPELPAEISDYKVLVIANPVGGGKIYHKTISGYTDAQAIAALAQPAEQVLVGTGTGVSSYAGLKFATNTLTVNNILRAPDQTSGNVNGTDLSLRAGRGYGSGTSGSVSIWTAPAGVSNGGLNIEAMVTSFGPTAISAYLPVTVYGGAANSGLALSGVASSGGNYNRIEGTNTRTDASSGPALQFVATGAQVGNGVGYMDFTSKKTSGSLGATDMLFRFASPTATLLSILNNNIVSLNTANSSFQVGYGSTADFGTVAALNFDAKLAAPTTGQLHTTSNAQLGLHNVVTSTNTTYSLLGGNMTGGAWLQARVSTSSTGSWAYTSVNNLLLNPLGGRLGHGTTTPNAHFHTHKTDTTNTSIVEASSTSAGTQFWVNDTISGDIYQVNDVSGLPILTADSSWVFTVWDYPGKLLDTQNSRINILKDLVMNSTTGYIRGMDAALVANSAGQHLNYSAGRSTGSAVGGSHNWYTTAAGVAGQATLNTETLTMSLGADGRLLVGTTDASTYKLITGGDIYAINAATSIGVRVKTTATNGVSLFAAYNNLNDYFSIQVNGSTYSGRPNRADLQTTLTNGMRFVTYTSSASADIVFHTQAGQSGGEFTNERMRIKAGGTVITNGSITAASALAQGLYANNTLVAAANNDVLVGVDINPTFTNGAFTGVSNIALRVQGTGLVRVAGLASGGGQRMLAANTSGDLILGPTMGQGYIPYYDGTLGFQSSTNFRYTGLVLNLNGATYGYGSVTLINSINTNSIVIGNDGNANIFYRGGTHYFRDVAGTTTYASIGATYKLNNLATGTGNGNQMVIVGEDGTLSKQAIPSGGGSTTLDGLTDVTITGVANNQLLKYNSGTSQWENWTPNFLTAYAETDPIFTAHAAYGITSGNITNWNTAYDKRPVSLAFTGTTTKTLTITLGDSTTISNTFTDETGGGGSVGSIEQVLAVGNVVTNYNLDFNDGVSIRKKSPDGSWWSLGVTDDGQTTWTKVI
jgi:hypothetical protein